MSDFARSYKRPEGDKFSWLQTTPGPACLDLVGSIRPKIFLLAKKITESVNTEAQLFEGLGLKNQITMQIIINFLDLKSGEIWLEMLKDVTDEEYNLMPSDARGLTLLTSISRNKASAVLGTQRYLMQRSKENDEINEYEFYKVMKKCHLQDHLKAVREADYLARTTNYAYLVEKRLWQKTELQKASSKAPPLARIHRTTDGPLNITVWPSRTKFITSEPPKRRLEDLGKASVDNITTILPVINDDQILGISESEDASIMSIRTSVFDLGIEDQHYALQPSEATMTTSNATPRSIESGFYMVSADALRKALQMLLAKEKKKNWLKRVGDDHYYRIRTKWKLDWYPEEKVTLLRAD